MTYFRLAELIRCGLPSKADTHKNCKKGSYSQKSSLRALNKLLMTQALTPEEWLKSIGNDIREHRLWFEGGTTRRDLASLAGVSVSALANLERGDGASMMTFVRVLRALECTPWLETLRPSQVINPMLLLETGKSRERVRKKKHGSDS